ncbi:MAG: hypothetical protein JW941_04615 [Candidatus Coatesbacteria bacterium]|nr:hypothetical protein [Candidatus Coatesbacteria bacterium]
MKKSNGSAILAVFTAAICLLGLAAIPKASYCGEWSSSELIDSRDGKYYASVSLDEDDNLHVAYLYQPDLAAPEIAYASNVSDEWERDQIAELQAYGGSRPDIAVDDEGTPYIVYSTLAADPPKLASFNGWFWETSECPSEQISHGAPLICIDSDDDAHIVFCYSDGSIQYLRREGLVWKRDILDANADDVTGIVADSSSQPHIVFLNLDGDLMCAKKSDDDWEYELIASPVIGLIGLWDSLAIDNEDNLRIAYLDGTPPFSSTLFIAQEKGGIWETEQVEDGGIWAQIAIGESYTSQIAHVQPYTQSGGTRYTYGDDLGWHSEEIPLSRYGQWSLDTRMTTMTANDRDLFIVYSGRDETSDGGGALLYMKGKQGRAVVGVFAELILNEDSFKMHDTIEVTARVTNGNKEVAVEAKVWLELPSGDIQSILDPYATFTIAPATDNIVPVYEFTFRGTEAPGDYVIHARLIDPITGTELSDDSDSFHFSAFK